MFRNPVPRHKTAPRICLDETFPLLFLSLLPHIYPPRPFLVTFSPSRCSCALPRWQLWSELGRFARIGRVLLSWEGQSAPKVSVICWIYAWKLWVWGLVVSCVGAGSVKALRGPRDLLRRSSPVRIFYRPRPLMFRNPTLRHKTALRICLEETFPRPSCHYFRIFTVCAPCLSENYECGG